jgi:ribosomal protein S18 acetylase RimI-like enzyme
MKYDIRSCEPGDLPTLVDLCEKHAAHEQAAYSPEGKLEAHRKAIFATSPSLHCYVVASAEGVVGYCTFTFDFSTWDAQRFLYLDCLYLNPEYRNLGIGKKIFDLLMDIAIQNQCVNLQWQTPVFNERAIMFYGRMGAKAKEKMRFSLEPKPVENCVG